MKKRLITAASCLILLIGLACNIMAEDAIELKDSFYAPPSSFDGFYSYNMPGFPGGIYLTSAAQADALEYYDLQFPWFDAIAVDLDGTYVKKTWTAGYLYDSSSSTIRFYYNISLITTPEYRVRLFFQNIPEYLLSGLEVQTASNTGGDPYIQGVPYNIYRCSDVPDMIYAFGMTMRDGTTTYMNEDFSKGTYADNVYLLEFDAYNLDVIAFQVIFKNVINVSYSDYADMDGSWFDTLEDTISNFPVLLGTMFKYFFTNVTFIGTLAVIAGCYVFAAAIVRWAG